MTNIWLAILLILGEAIPEGLRPKHPTLAGIIEFLYRAPITLVLFAFVGGAYLNSGVQDYYFYHIGGYLLVRYAIFDFVYNWCKGLPLYYIGDTKVYDKVWRWFFDVTGFPPKSFLFLTKAIAIFIGIVFLLK